MELNRLFNHVRPEKTALQTALRAAKIALYCLLKKLKGQTKNARKPLLSSVITLYPRRESNPHSRNGHRILSPEGLGENQ